MPGTTLAPYIISFSVFAVVFCMVWAGIALYRDYVVRRAMLEKVRDEISGDSLFLDGPSPVLQGKHHDNIFMSMFKKIGSRYAGEKRPQYSVLRVEFLRAGIQSRMAVQVFWGVKITLMVVLPLVFFGFRLASIGLSDHVLTLAICCALGLAGLYAPDVWLRFMIASRKGRISRSLPNALDMLVVCVEAGLGLDAAISKVSEEIRLTCPDLSDEFRLYNLEMRAGTAREEALNSLSRRTDLEEIRSLVNLLIQTNKFGTSLAQGLRVYAESFRTKRFMRAEEVAAKLPTKLMLPVLFFIFPALFVVIALPAAIRLYFAFIAPGN